MKKNEIEEKMLGEVTKSGVFMEDLACQLSTDELGEAAHKLATYLKEKSELEQQKKDVNAKFNSQISTLETAIEEITEVINIGETRPVECIWEFNWETNDKVLVRLDTDEDERVGRITEEDRQMHMVLEETGA